MLAQIPTFAQSDLGVHDQPAPRRTQPGGQFVILEVISSKYMSPSARTRPQCPLAARSKPSSFLSDNFSSPSSNMIRDVRPNPTMLAAIVLFGLLSPAYAQSEDQTPEVMAPNDYTERFKWKTALAQSGILLGVQHAGRIVQRKTRRELAGPFWSDYFASASSIHTWNDGDSIATNYFGHPVMGAVTGYIQIFNDPRGQQLEFDLSSKQYWKSRLKAMAWSAAYSAQFEIGPISEASIGNVGKHPPAMAVTDLVVTPFGGFATMLLEDYLDKRFVSRLERGGGMKARFYRIVLNPSRSIANVLRWKRPSYRDNRPL